jgi:AraC-like DNA-binding protein
MNPSAFAATGLLLPAVRFDACDAPDASPQGRLDHWRATVAPTVEIDVAPEQLTADWSVRTSGWNVGGTMIVLGSYSPQTLTRRPRPTGGDPFDHYVLHLNQAPQAFSLATAERRVSVGPRQSVLTDFAQPRSLQCGHGEVLSMFIPRPALDALLPRPLDLHGVLLEGACSTILASHLQSLSALLPRMTRKEAPDAMQATLQLVAASLAPSVHRLGLARPVTDGTLLQQIRRFMEDNLSDEGLGADRICAHFRISRSTLYRLFEAEGGVSSYLQDRRLLRIHGLLASPSQHCYLGRLAEDNGFKSATHFSRAFRAKFGYSPRETRAQRGCAAERSVDAPARAGANDVAGNVARTSTLGRWLTSSPSFAGEALAWRHGG